MGYHTHTIKPVESVVYCLNNTVSKRIYEVLWGEGGGVHMFMVSVFKNLSFCILS